MSGDLVVAPSDRSWHSGTGLLDSTASYCEALASESWVDAALSGVAVGFDVYATVVDPFGSLFAAGIGWIIDHLEPLKSWFDDLAGNPEEVAAFAGTWQNVSSAVDDVRTDYLQEANRRLGEMTGPGVDAYRQHVENQGDRLQLLATVSQGLSVGYDAMSVLVTFVHSLVRDAIAQVVGAILSYVAELIFTLGAATPLVIHQATTRVSALVSEVVPKIQGLTRSGQSLDEIMSTLRDILNDIPRFLGSRYSVPNHPGLRWNTVLTENGSWIRQIPGYEGATVAEQLRIVGLRRRYAHFIENDPALWNKVIRDALGASTPNSVNDAVRQIVEAAERQLAGG